MKPDPDRNTVLAVWVRLEGEERAAIGRILDRLEQAEWWRETTDDRLIPLNEEEAERFRYYAAVAQATGIAQFRDDLRAIVARYERANTEVWAREVIADYWSALALNQDPSWRPW